jgi:hypothetical protein
VGGTDEDGEEHENEDNIRLGNQAGIDLRVEQMMKLRMKPG